MQEKEETQKKNIDENTLNNQNDKTADASVLSNNGNSTKDISEQKTGDEQSAIKEIETKLAETNDKYIRLYADFENYRKRITKERIDLIKFAGEDIFIQLLPVIDDFERAIKAATQAKDMETIKQGEQLIYNKFKNILTQNGLQEINSAGQIFDSELHDAVTNIPSPSEDMKGKVVEEVEKGYYLNGKVIRHTKVIVGN
ncbi:MAG: nucleotide exchange factor GrpE [Bacteroidota bacterium]